ncbi:MULTISPECIES: hypothetical protein [Olivibacter]|uniref:Helix-turn-helix domain-containing protein n=1 Tax=Olivibacter jilunii TaxID=985016 RepID=A0ABW6B7W1_9SPHI|nr:hypothetical protein [Pseudosphingobacterium sp.]
MNNFDKLLTQLQTIQDKFTNIENFLTSNFIDFQKEQLKELLHALKTLSATSSDPSEQLKEKEEDTLHDARYAAERIGVSEKTISRLTGQGMLPIHSYVNRKRQFRKSDIDRCRRYYRGE